ncbi:MAG: ABC transporter permease, partial [Acidobacteria bacterium]|nr:ABC transporter permease [Acidobacteriota bacterium]
MKDIWQDLRYGARSLMRRKGFTTVAVITLALGIGGNTAIFTIVNAVLLRPLPYPESEKLMVVGRYLAETSAIPDFSQPKFIFLRDNVKSFEALTATQERPNDYLSDENQTDYIRSMMVSADFFRVLGVQPASGRAFTLEEDSPAGEPVAILSDELWRRRLGADIGVIGRTIRINSLTYTVIGIMPPNFEFFGPQDVFVPLRTDPASQNEGHNYTVIGRLKDRVTTDQARSELKLLFDTFRAAHPGWVKENETFGLMSWRSSITGSIRELLWILLGAVTLVLLIACANIANLQLTRATARRKEMAIRRALGAGSGRLIRQLLTEGVVLALLGGVAGLLLAIWGLDAMLAMVPEGMIPRVGEINLDWRVLVFALGASLLTGVIFGLAPALQMLRVDVNHALKEGLGRTGAEAGRGRLRSVLVVVEVALALALSVGAGLLLRTFVNLHGVDPGFEARNVLTFEISPRGRNYDSVAKLSDFYRHALERFSALPGVETAALTNKLPLDAQFNLPYKLVGQSKFAGAVQYRVISPEYFRVMKMAIQRGRPFGESDTVSSEPVAIVNEAFARSNFAGVEPLGQQLCAGCEYGDPAMRRVVGVTNETKQRSLSEAAPAAVFIPLTQAAEGVKGTLRQCNFILRTQGDPSLLSAAIRSEMRQLDPTVPMRNLYPMEQLVSRSVAPQRFNLILLGLFAALGLLLTAVGIYGVMAYSVSQRTHEIGLRMALGAQPGDVLKLIMKQGMTLALVGVVIGIIASFALTRVIKSLLFNVSATD